MKHSSLPYLLSQLSWLAPVTASLAFFIIFTTVSLHRFWQYSVWYYDFGIFYQAISAVARGEAPIIDHFIFSGKNILGDHFHPLIFLISPLYALTQRAETLLVVQALFVALSGLVMYAVGRELLKNRLAAFCFMVVYYSFVGLHNALITEFHELALLPLPLSIFFLGMVKKSWRWYGLGLIGILLTKETTFIIPAWFGLIVALSNRGNWRRIGLATTILSGLYGLVVIKLVIPWFGGMPYYYLTEAMGKSSLFESFGFKMTTVFKTLLSFGFLPVLAPETLGPVLFNWWSRFESEGSRHDLGMHYNAEIAPTLLLGAMMGWKRLTGWLTIFFKQHQRRLQQSSQAGLVMLATFTIFLSLYVFKSPALLFFNPAFYQHTSNFEFLDDLMAAIPEEGVVMAQHNLAGKLAYRQVYILRDNYWKYSPDYIVIDTRDGQEPNNFLGLQDFPALIEALASDPDYEVYYLQGEQMIYQRVDATGEIGGE
jgi:uncharacterized membrane protein